MTEKGNKSIGRISLSNTLNLDRSTIVTKKLDANEVKYPVSEYYSV